MGASWDLLRDRLVKALQPRGARSEFCRKTGVARSNVERWITNETIPGVDMLDRIAEGLGAPAWKLLRPEMSQGAQQKDEPIGSESGDSKGERRAVEPSYVGGKRPTINHQKEVGNAGSPLGHTALSAQALRALIREEVEGALIAQRPSDELAELHKKLELLRGHRQELKHVEDMIDRTIRAIEKHSRGSGDAGAG